LDMPFEASYQSPRVSSIFDRICFSRLFLFIYNDRSVNSSPRTHPPKHHRIICIIPSIHPLPPPITCPDLLLSESGPKVPPHLQAPHLLAATVQATLKIPASHPTPIVTQSPLTRNMLLTKHTRSWMSPSHTRRTMAWTHAHRSIHMPQPLPRRKNQPAKGASIL